MIIKQPTYACRPAGRTLFADSPLTAWQVASGYTVAVYHFADGSTVVVDDQLTVSRYTLAVDHDVASLNAADDNLIFIGPDVHGNLAVSVSSDYDAPTKVSTPTIAWADVVGVDALDALMTVYHKTSTGVKVLLICGLAYAKRFISPTPTEFVNAVAEQSDIHGCTVNDVVVGDRAIFADFTPAEVIARQGNRNVVLRMTADRLTVTTIDGSPVTELNLGVDRWFTCQDPTFGAIERDAAAILVVYSGASAKMYLRDGHWADVATDWLNASHVTAAVLQGVLPDAVVDDLTTCVEFAGVYVATVNDHGLTQAVVTTGTGVTSLRAAVGGPATSVHAVDGELVLVNPYGVVRLPSNTIHPLNLSAARPPSVVRRSAGTTEAVGVNLVTDGSAVIERLIVADGEPGPSLKPDHPAILPNDITAVAVTGLGSGYAVAYVVGGKGTLNIYDATWALTRSTPVDLPTAGFKLVSVNTDVVAGYVESGHVTLKWLTSSESAVIDQPALTSLGVVSGDVYATTPAGAHVVTSTGVVDLPGVKLLAAVDGNVVALGDALAVLDQSFGTKSTLPLFSCTPLILERVGTVYVLVFAVNDVVKCLTSTDLRFVSPDVEYLMM